MSVKETIKRTVQGIAKLTQSGAEVCDPKPRTLPTGIKRPPTQEERFRRILQAHQTQMQEDQEYRDETDFDIDEPDMLSPYERSAHVFDLAPEILAEQSAEGAHGDAESDTAKQPAPPSGTEQSEE